MPASSRLPRAEWVCCFAKSRSFAAPAFSEPSPRRKKRSARGMLVLFGQSSGPVKPVDPQILNQKGSLFLTRPGLAHHIATKAELAQRSSEVLGWGAQGRLKLRIGAEFALKDAADAHRALEGRKTTGKVLLTP